MLVLVPMSQLEDVNPALDPSTLFININSALYPEAAECVYCRAILPTKRELHTHKRVSQCFIFAFSWV